MPLFASRHIYQRIVGEQAHRGDSAIVFNIYVDDNFKPDKRKGLGVKGEPDAISFAGGASIAEIYLYLCIAENGEDFTKNWNDAPWPGGGAEEWQKATETLLVRGVTLELAEFIADPDKVVSTIKRLYEEAEATAHGAATS